LTQKFVIIGAGGQGREVLDIFEACNNAGEDYEVLGYLVESNYGNPGTLINDKPILGDLDWLEPHKSNVQVVTGVGDPALRQRLIIRAREYGAHFGNIIHPSVILTRRISFGEGIVIAAGCILTNQIHIGNHVHVNYDCTIGHDTSLEDFVTLSPGVHVSGNVMLREGCYVGTGAVIIEKKTIGAWSLIGAGSVVIADVPPNSVVVGNPAKVIKSREGINLSEQRSH
jgi:sugar O-acyltransferase (sialic acid O-acetyltransferase NeuD family)